MQSSYNSQKNIAVAIDNNFITHAFVMLNSLFSNNGTNFYIHILDGGLNILSKLKIWFYFKSKHIPYKIYPIDHREIESAPVHGHVNLSSYNRIFLSEVLSDVIDRVVYLDCDIIVMGSIAPLFQIDLKDNYVAAVPEITDEKTVSRLNLKNKYNYFNAGVLIVNLNRWRSDSLKEKMISFILTQKDKIVYWDQDVLNYCIQDKWLPLEHNFNVTHFFFYPEKFTPEYFGLSPKEYDEVKNSIKILHFTSNSKPWLPDCKHPMKNKYFEYQNVL